MRRYLTPITTHSRWLAGLALFVVLCLMSTPAAAEQPAQENQAELSQQQVDDTQGVFENGTFTGELPVTFDGPAPPTPPSVISRDENGRVTIRAVRVGEELVIDGRLDEPIYSRVEAISDFIMQEPQDNVPATEKTETWIFFDDRNLYVSGRNWDSQPDQIIANDMRRDGNKISQNDNFTLTLDTFYDRRNGYFFQTNPLGALRDGLISDERQLNGDWNTVWDVRTTRFDQGWTVEIIIPFKSLRYGPGRNQVWGINVRRGVQWKNEDSFITAMPRSLQYMAQFRLSLAATLVGLQVPSGSRNLEFKPYAISGTTGVRNASDTVINDFSRDIGFDGKYGLTQGLTADFTVNTDFAQVEDDDEQVRTMLDMLVLTGLIERFVDGDGDVMDLWVITDEAIEWVLDPHVQADMSVANTVFDMQVQA